MTSFSSPTSAGILPKGLDTFRRPVVKIGSALIDGSGRDGTPIDLAGLVSDMIGSFHPTADLTIVSSGAVALGRQRQATVTENLAGKQALSAIGQIDLMARWQRAFEVYDRHTAQILLTPDTTARRRRYLNARATFRTLHEAGAVPVVNENDAVATEELRYGDNDRLAAMTAGLIDADLLILITNIDGVYDGDPRTNPDADHLSAIDWDHLSKLDRRGMENGSSVGTGGMASKVGAAHLAGSWGIPVLIMDGRPDAPFTSLGDGASRATHIAPAPHPARARKRWLTGLGGTQFSADKPGEPTLTIDAGAAAAIRGGASLLAVGISAISGNFVPGDVVTLLDADNASIGFGLTRMGHEGIDTDTPDIVLHRDDLVLTVTSE